MEIFDKEVFIIVCALIAFAPTRVFAGLCDLRDGNTNIILEMEESRSDSISQKTPPLELPVIGTPNVDIYLELSFPKQRDLFVLNGRNLTLIAPIDREENGISHLIFQLICTVKKPFKKRTIPVIVKLIDVNDNAPQFVNIPYETSISELTPVGTTIFQRVVAKDKDAGLNGMIEYRIVKGDDNLDYYYDDDGLIGRERPHTEDGYGYFTINLPHQGQVTVNRTLDYEKTQRYYVTIVATDLAVNISQRKSSTTTLVVNIKDDDDLNPTFLYRECMIMDGGCINPEYSSSVSSGVLHGVLSISPEKIQAVDMDTLNTRIRYTFINGSPDSYADYFQIDPDTGIVRQIKPVDTSQTKKFSIIVKAQEVSETKRSTTAKLFITVKPVDANPPEIVMTAFEGFVDENSPIGQRVETFDGIPFVVSVIDKDYGENDPKPNYTFELTSPLFAVDKDGYLLVNERNLDRDPPNPNQYKFQIVAREVNGIAASAPVSVVVHLNDANDNAPLLPNLTPITIPAGQEVRTIMTIKAIDKDDGENSIITYSLYHASNNGSHKFQINPETGELAAFGTLTVGEQYSLTIQATDRGGLYSQSILEITISPGPNTQSPIFDQTVYDAEVSEGATINSTVITLTAVDPENDPVTYSIVSGNNLAQFSIGPTSGVITVIKQLDREEVSSYNLVVQAADSGDLFSLSTVNIKVNDINDKNPTFVGDPYKFSVKEGLEGRSVGFVHANDADEGINAIITYAIPNKLPFVIDNVTGEITTRKSLDYEDQKAYQFVVTAKDGAPDPRIATATVAVEVIDIEDELPYFPQQEYTISVAENMGDFLIVELNAIDPDSLKRITYVIRQGQTDLFRIESHTGALYTTRGLDYEKDTQYVLIIGTLENTSNKPDSTVKITVNVEDRNDIPPVFTVIPHPITLDDDVVIGTAVTTLVAIDSDGTSPGNKVRYEIIGRGKAPKYFQIDPDTGLIRVTNDLKKEIETEYQVDVQAYDLGEPQLSSVTTLDIYVQHVATAAPEVGLRFADVSYNVQLPESTEIGHKIKSLTIVNSKTHGSNIPLKCEITAGNSEEKFMVNITDDRNCAIYLNGKLDFEQDESYQIQVEIMSLQGFINKEFATTQVVISVLDVNDNAPSFIYPNTTTLQKYYAAVSHNAPLSTAIIQIKVHDKDSGKYSKLKYTLNGTASDLFSIDADSGVIKTKKPFDGIEDDNMPFFFTVTVRDNPSAFTDFFTVDTTAVINVIRPENRIILVIGDAKPNTIEKKLDTIISVVQEQTNLIMGVEKLTSREYLGTNGTLETDYAGTDLWFYLIDPANDLVLSRNNSIVKKSIFDKSAMDNITFDITGQIKNTAFNIHEPFVLQTIKTASVTTLNSEVFPYALIIIAFIIFVLGIAGIIYICVSWSRYRTFKEQVQRQYVPSSPARYDTVYVEPNLKEYETQVLQMCVPVDEHDDYNDLHLDFSSKNHTFNLDNVSYISKNNNMKDFAQISPNSSESTTARTSSIYDNRIGIKNGDLGTFRKEHIYSRSSDDEDMNASPTNDNVMFKEKKDYSHSGFQYDRSPVETTTEL